MKRSTRSRRPRPTLGLFIYGRPDSQSVEMWAGVAGFCREHDLNAICFAAESPGDLLEYRGQANVLYDLAGPESVDGLILWRSVLEAFDREALPRLCERYRPLPLVNVGLPLEGIPSISLDTYRAMRQAVTHLIEVHGRRRIAFVHGLPVQEGEETFRAYRDALTGHSLAAEAGLVVRCGVRPEATYPSHWQRQVGEEAIRLLVDERGAAFDAVVGANDGVVTYALEALRTRGIRVPGDVAVVGFSEYEGSRCTRPPLTTVSLRLHERARRATELLCALLRGERTPESVILPAKLIVRQSCGCPDRAVARAAGPGARFAEQPVSETDVKAQRPAILAVMKKAAAPIAGLDRRWAERLLDAFFDDLEEQTGGFVAALDEMLRRAIEADDEPWPGPSQGIDAWHEIVSALRSQALPHLGAGERLAHAEDLWQQARALVGQQAKQDLASRSLQAEREASVLREVGHRLSITFDTEELARVLAQELPRLGVRRGYVALYEDPRAPETWARLILACDETGLVEMEEAGRRFPSRQVIPPDLWPGDRACHLVVEPLYFRDEQLGFAAFEADPSQMGTCYTLRGYLSTALKGAQLLRQSSDARAAAERADRLKTRLLANVSHELRTPLDCIIGLAGLVHDAVAGPESEPPAGVPGDLARIRESAEHLLRLINDLLDLSRADIDALDLDLALVEPRPLLESAFHSVAGTGTGRGSVEWRLDLPARLPLIRADPTRLRQILLNLLSNARKFTDRGQITLGAEVSPPHLHLWVQDSGAGIPAGWQEQIFEPFGAAERSDRHYKGIGLGLSITRRLVALHGGSMALDSQPGEGSTFHVTLPLPSLDDRPASPPAGARPVLLLVSGREEAADEIAALARHQGLEIRRLQPGESVEDVLAETRPSALAWDLAGGDPGSRHGEWATVQQLRAHPRLRRAPFVLYAQEAAGGPGLTAGLTNVVLKPAGGATLSAAIDALRPPGAAGPVLVVDDDAKARERHCGIVTEAFPGCPVRTAGDGAEALALMNEETPCLVILDLVMPGVDGFQVLDAMRADPRTRQVPVLILSGRALTFDDVERLERHALVTFQSKDVLSADETAAALHRALFGDDALPPHTGALVKRTIAYFHQHYDHPLTREEVASAVGASESYITHIFRQELGLSPWDYVKRYRVNRAKDLLRATDETITSIAQQVGFDDPSYFGRVFRKVTGLSPSEYRKQRA